ncbi:MAG: ABC transporter ATP-binding protein [Actinomycetota bacterium]
MSGLAFEGVHKRYGGVVALAGFDLVVREGELLVLLGPSGCGKTTALRIAAGLESADEGRVLIGGNDVGRVAPAKRNVSMVFQSYALFPHLTVEENIGFGLRARRAGRMETARRVREAAALVRCEDVLDRKPFQLSGGQRQRVALARALARHPDAFLLDEPLSNLDARLRVETRVELESLHRRLGATMVYVTHDQVEALTMGDRVAVMRDGRVEQVGTPEDVYRRPANRFVAGFIGSPAMNVLPVSVKAERLHAGPFSFSLRGPDEANAKRPLDLGVRPEHLAMASGSSGAAVTVSLVENAGPDAYLYVEADEQRLVVRVDSSTRVKAGDEIRLAVRRANTHLFDAETGESLEGTP